MSDYVKEYERLKNFWNEAFRWSEEERKEIMDSVDAENGWKEMAPSEKLFRAAEELGSCRNVLDYGCGSGWAGLIASKSGAGRVTAVDVSEKAADQARQWGEHLKAVSYSAENVPEDWLEKIPADTFDGLFCSNVLDVVPDEVARRLLAGLSRVLTPDGSAVFGFNFYLDPAGGRGTWGENDRGCYMYQDGVLRLVSRTDEAWTGILGEYFHVESLTHFSWPGEKAETRRLFRCRKKAILSESPKSAEKRSDVNNHRLETERLTLRPWKMSDAEDLFSLARNPEVGPIAGWPPHTSVEGSRWVIENVLNGRECYALCLRGTDSVLGAIELKMNGRTDMTDRDDECELGYWLGQPYWGRGYMPEAGRELVRHAFEELNMTAVWCGYYDGNVKSRRVQEKLGFSYHHTTPGLEVPLMNEIRTGHTNVLTYARWLRIREENVGNGGRSDG